MAGCTDDSDYRCLDEFLNQDVDQDVQFVGSFVSETNKPAENDQVPREDSGESDEIYIIYMDDIRPFREGALVGGLGETVCRNVTCKER